MWYGIIAQTVIDNYRMQETELFEYWADSETDCIEQWEEDMKENYSIWDGWEITHMSEMYELPF